MLAVTIAIAMKIVGVLLVIAFLIVPAVAARPFAATPERMAVLAGLVAVASVVVGPRRCRLTSTRPGGPAIVLVMACLAGLSLAYAAVAPAGLTPGATPASWINQQLETCPRETRP